MAPRKRRTKASGLTTARPRRKSLKQCIRNLPYECLLLIAEQSDFETRKAFSTLSRDFWRSTASMCGIVYLRKHERHRYVGSLEGNRVAIEECIDVIQHHTRRKYITGVVMTDDIGSRITGQVLVEEPATSQWNILAQKFLRFLQTMDTLESLKLDMYGIYLFSWNYHMRSIHPPPSLKHLSAHWGTAPIYQLGFKSDFWMSVGPNLETLKISGVAMVLNELPDSMPSIKSIDIEHRREALDRLLRIDCPEIQTLRVAGIYRRDLESVNANTRTVEISPHWHRLEELDLYFGGLEPETTSDDPTQCYDTLLPIFPALRRLRIGHGPFPNLDSLATTMARLQAATALEVYQLDLGLVLEGDKIEETPGRCRELAKDLASCASLKRLEVEFEGPEPYRGPAPPRTFVPPPTRGIGRLFFDRADTSSPWVEEDIEMYPRD